MSVNPSLSSGTFPDQFKHSVIKPLLKKCNLDRESLSSYRPISKLPFISKLIERLVKAQLTEHLDANSLFNSQKFAIMKHHSTKMFYFKCMTTLLKPSAINPSQAFVCCDTIDHSILLERLSHWFAGITSDLHSRTFSVATNVSVSGTFSVSYGVPQRSVVGPLLFLLYTTPLSSR